MKRAPTTPPKLIAFQVKSHKEFSSRDLLRILKAQRDDCFRKVLGLQEFYILLCTDHTENTDKVRGICAEFRSATRTKVIEPAYAHGFLFFAPRRFEALVSRALSSEDWVYRRAAETVDLPTPSAAVLLIHLAVCALRGEFELSLDDLNRDGSLRRGYDLILQEAREELEVAGAIGSGERQPDDEWHLTTAHMDFEEALAVDLEVVIGEFLHEESGGRLRLNEPSLLPLLALATDAAVRHEIETDELEGYLLHLLGLVE